MDLTGNELEQTLRRQEILRELHMAGLTSIDRVDGYSMEGFIDLGVSYGASIDSIWTTEYSGYYQSRTTDPGRIDRLHDYIEANAYDELESILSGEAVSLPDTVIIVDGLPFVMKRYPFHDDELGRLFKWFDADWVAKASLDYRVPQEAE